ncbi:MAG: MFS transporter [Asticcacaulis sp.]|nr:MFS transporter [Asticcacaulis sp.]
MNRLPHAREDSLLAGVFLAFMATAGLFYVNIMSAIVDGLMSGLGFSAKDAGMVASANVYGAAIGALTAVFLVKRVPWRRAAVILLGLLMAMDTGSLLVHTAPLLIALRFIHGLMGGLLVGISYGVISRTKVPEKVFGVLLVVQFGLGGLGLMYLPRLVPHFGFGVLFLSLAAFSLMSLLMVPFLAPYERPAVDPLQKTGPMKLLPLILTFVAMFTFQAANMGLAAFIIGLGRDAGLDLEPMTSALGWANWIGTLGSVLVIVMGLRFGRLLPAMAGLVLTLGGTFAFHWIYGVHGLDVYFWANILTAITWAFVIPYLLGMCAAFDPQGRMAALGGFFSKMGLASGPLAAALIVNAKLGYGLLINLTVAALFVSMIAMVLPALALDRQGRQSEASLE